MLVMEEWLRRIYQVHDVAALGAPVRAADRCRDSSQPNQHRMPGLFGQVADDDPATVGQMLRRFSERRDTAAGVRDETVAAVRKDDHVEAAGQDDVFKKPLDDIS